MTRFFADRIEAGRELAQALKRRWPELAAPDRPSAPVVLGLPRGGIVVAAEVAGALKAPLDALIVRKISYPIQPEMAIGAIGPNGKTFLQPYIDTLDLTEGMIERAAARARAEWDERNRVLRAGKPAPDVKGRVVVVVDDGIATGATAMAALHWLRESGARRLIMAVPVGPEQAAEAFAGVTDELLCLLSPQDFYAVGQVYRDFSQVDDAAVLELLRGR
ncbi:MAG TPA: phosphoribosyltransferase family protein [Symbiobacteriaceae bacterium]|nr:phosphoribosyltransferase family protein [Symbiobacteriaceae bacterium]